MNNSTQFRHSAISADSPFDIHAESHYTVWDFLYRRYRMLRSTYAVVSPAAMDRNIALALRGLNPGTKLLAVIKANAYGHGLTEIGTHLDANPDVTMFGVALCEEGVRLREAGVKKPILILGVTDDAHFDAVVQYGLTPAVFTPAHVRSLAAAAQRAEKSAEAHIKIDTGMHRIGVTDDAMLSSVLDAFDVCKGVKLSGVFTHFAKSENDPAFTALQAGRFDRAVAAVRARGYAPIVHAANSGAILGNVDYSYDMVRYGIAMYGCHPDGVSTPGSGLSPALSLVSHISNLKTLAPGEGVSYGQKFVTSRETVVATLPIGYGDGYKRALTGKASVLIGGKRCPQIGTICMDQIMVDVTDVPGVSLGDEAVLLGRQGDEEISADELAALANTISYEILLSISERVPRVYI